VAIQKVASFEGKFNRNIAEIEEKARKLVHKGGIHPVNVHDNPVMGASSSSKHFDILVTVFCLESASSSLEQYRHAMGNTLELLRPGGYFVLGTLIGHDAYNAGMCMGAKSAKFFTILNLSEEFVMGCLKEFGMDTETAKKLSLEDEGVLFLMVKKLR